MHTKRCSWVNENSTIYKDYHDNEWGLPVYDDGKLYEMFLLETFQAGLSWITILKKREFFREAFDHFDVEKVASYNEDKYNKLMENPGIIRNRNKISSAIKNAQIFISIQEEYESFSNYIWSFTDNKVIRNRDDIVRASTPLSDMISKDLIVRGMKYVGSITIYSYLQAIGIVNDHDTSCFKYN